MSGDTPTRYGGMKLHNLDCPDCSGDVFARAVYLFSDGESEHCPECGSLVTISTDGESPVDVSIYEHSGDVVARLLAEVERLTPDTPGAVSDHVRARVAEACQSHIDGDGGGCVAKGCIPGHQGQELLDAYDDARAGFAAAAENCERLCAESVERGLTIEQLTREVGAFESTIGDLKTRLLAEEMTAAALEQERDAVKARAANDGRTIIKMGKLNGALMERAETAEQALAARLRDLCQVYGRNECGQRFPSKSAEDAAARRVAKRNGWDCYPEDSTTDEPGFDGITGKLSSDETEEAFLALATADDGPGGDQ